MESYFYRYLKYSMFLIQVFMIKVLEVGSIRPLQLCI